jgi:hypothetical protein
VRRCGGHNAAAAVADTKTNRNRKEMHEEAPFTRPSKPFAAGTEENSGGLPAWPIKPLHRLLISSADFSSLL